MRDDWYLIPEKSIVRYMDKQQSKNMPFFFHFDLKWMQVAFAAGYIVYTIFAFSFISCEHYFEESLCRTFDLGIPTNTTAQSTIEYTKAGCVAEVLLQLCVCVCVRMRMREITELIPSLAWRQRFMPLIHLFRRSLCDFCFALHCRWWLTGFCRNYIHDSRVFRCCFIRSQCHTAYT